MFWVFLNQHGIQKRQMNLPKYFLKYKLVGLLGRRNQPKLTAFFFKPVGQFFFQTKGQFDLYTALTPGVLRGLETNFSDKQTLNRKESD